MRDDSAKGPKKKCSMYTARQGIMACNNNMVGGLRTVRLLRRPYFRSGSCLYICREVVDLLWWLVIRYLFCVGRRADEFSVL